MRGGVNVCEFTGECTQYVHECACMYLSENSARLWRARSETRPCLHHQKTMRTSRKLQTPIHCWPVVNNKRKTNTFSVHVKQNLLTYNAWINRNEWFLGFQESDIGSERLPWHACAPWGGLWTGWVHYWLRGDGRRNVNYYCCQRCGLEMIWEEKKKTMS